MDNDLCYLEYLPETLSLFLGEERISYIYVYLVSLVMYVFITGMTGSMMCGAEDVPGGCYLICEYLEFYTFAPVEAS